MKIFKERKKCLSLIIVLLMIFTCAPTLAFAETSSTNIVDGGTCGERLEWSLTTDGTLTISGVGEMDNYDAYCDIEDIYEDEWVYFTSTPWDIYREDITKVIIKKGAASIGDAAFAYCMNLTSAVIPDGIKSIGSSAFDKCEKLTNITIPSSVKTIGYDAFSDCKSLVSIIIPNGVKTIESHTFYGCKKLKSVTIPDSVGLIDSSAFSDCSSLTNVTIPGSVKTIGNGAFGGCHFLENVTIQNGVQKIEDNVFSKCPYLTSATIPSSVTSIGYDVFQKRSDFYIICEPDSVAVEYAETYGFRYKLKCSNHSWNEEYTIDIEPTCSEEGSKSIHCALCDEIKNSIAIPTTNHMEVKDVAVSATCTESGLTEGSHCSVCDKIIVAQEKTKPTGHSFGKWTIDNKPTCTEDGSKYRECKSCGIVDNDMIYATGHNTDTVITRATTSEAGSIVKTCYKCKKTISETDIAAIKTVRLTASTYTFNGSAKVPNVSIKDTNGDALIKNTDYTLKYNSSGTNVGKHTVTLKLKGQYAGTETLAFKINPAAKSISKVTPSKKAFTVKWSKPSSTYRKQMTGYQIQYSTSSKMTKPIKVTVKSTTATSKKISGSKVKAKKTYYVQMRTYKKIGSSYYYADWSKVKKVKTK